MKKKLLSKKAANQTTEAVMLIMVSVILFIGMGVAFRYMVVGEGGIFSQVRARMQASPETIEQINTTTETLPQNIIKEWDLSINQDRTIIGTYNKNDKTLNIEGNGGLFNFGYDVDEHQKIMILRVCECNDWDEYSSTNCNEAMDNIINNGASLYDESYIEGKTWKELADEDVHYPFETLIINEGITDIGLEHFLDCYFIKNVQFPDSLITISDESFSACTSLETIRIPKNVTSIGLYAFATCSNLKEIYIPKSVSRISNGAFIDISPDSIIYCETQEVANLFKNNRNYYSSDTQIIVSPEKF